jgi:hypothetical protein
MGSMVLSAKDVTLDGTFRLAAYKNSLAMDSVLTVDTCGRLKLVSQNSLQTIAKNAFLNGGNNFGAASHIGTKDNHPLNFITNNLMRGGIDENGVLNYDNAVNINNSKLKVTGDIEVNGIQPYVTQDYQKASNGINFAAGGESLARGTITLNITDSRASINHTSFGSFKFYSGLPGVPSATLKPDLSITEGVFRFGSRHSNDVEEESAAYQFKNSFDASGKPRGVLFPKVANNVVRDYQTAPADGLIFFNESSQNLQIKKSDGWHNILTKKEEVITEAPKRISTSTETATVNSNSYVQALGDGQQKTFKIKHNLNAQFVMVQFIDCGPEANCNILQILPKGARVELDGKNNAQVTFEEAPSFNRYKIMFLRVQ